MRQLSTLFVIIFFCLTRILYGSFEKRGIDARAEAMGGAGTALYGSFGHLYNPASIDGSGTHAAGFSYALPFGQRDFDSFTGSFESGNLPFDRNAGAALSWQHYGSPLYNETSLYASFATKVWGKLRGGISAGMLKRHAEGKEEQTVAALNLGLLAALSPSLNLGISVFNLNRPGTGSGNEKAPITGSAGIAYKPLDTVTLGACLEKQQENRISLKTGGEISVFGHLYLRAGFSTEPSTVSGGAGLAFGDFMGDVAFIRQPELGTGSICTIRVSF